jgi:hypothetical protein
MDNLFWFPVWLLIALPIPSTIFARRLLRKLRQDYAYYIEWREFPIIKIAAVKFTMVPLVGYLLSTLQIPAESLTVAAGAFGICGFVCESIILIDRPHPTRTYHPVKLVCTSCQGNKCEDCTNLRMLDSFETGFKSREGTYRPVCCCGFRISPYRELTT